MKKNLKIGPYTWEFDDEAVDLSPKEWGNCDFAALTIKIKDLPNADVKKQVILHELLHAFLVSSGFSVKNEENLVDILASQLLFFIKSNPEFFKTYFL